MRKSGSWLGKVAKKLRMDALHHGRNAKISTKKCFFFSLFFHRCNTTLFPSKFIKVCAHGKWLNQWDDCPVAFVLLTVKGVGFGTFTLCLTVTLHLSTVGRGCFSRGPSILAYLICNYPNTADYLTENSLLFNVFPQDSLICDCWNWDQTTNLPIGPLPIL